jgi:hypothetical protein
VTGSPRRAHAVLRKALADAMRDELVARNVTPREHNRFDDVGVAGDGPDNGVAVLPSGLIVVVDDRDLAALEHP